MNKRLLVLLGSVFALGWVLSWLYFDTPPAEVDSASADSAALPRAASADSSPAALADADKPSGQPDSEKPADLSASILDITRERLQRGEFEAVMADYAEAQSRLAESDAVEHRRLILDYARSLLGSDRAADARSLLDLYLDHEFRDVTALLLMAEIHEATGNEMAAIEILFRAKSHAYTPELIEQTDQVLRLTIRDYDSRLLNRNDYIARLNLYRRLTELEPEHTPHFIALAETYLALGNAADARQTLALTRHDASVVEQANDIERRIDASLNTDRQYAAAVSLQPFGNQFLVGAVLNDAHNAVLLLDTGASLSIISNDSLRSLGIPHRATGTTAWFSTAGGRIQAPVVVLDSLAVDDMVVENIEVGVIGEFDGGPFDGLLGMNFLRHFEFLIDQSERKLRLSPYQ